MFRALGVLPQIADWIFSLVGACSRFDKSLNHLIGVGCMESLLLYISYIHYNILRKSRKTRLADWR